MFKKSQSFIFKENSFEDTYINDTGDFALPATINRNITEHPSNRDMYILISPTIIDKPLSYSKIIFEVILILLILYYLI